MKLESWCSCCGPVTTHARRDTFAVRWCRMIADGNGFCTGPYYPLGKPGKCPSLAFLGASRLNIKTLLYWFLYS